MNGDLLNNYKLEGDLLDVLTFPNPHLTKKSEKIADFNEELEILAKNMLYTMYNAPGIGLAAPQVGKNIRLFVIDVNYSREEITNANGDIDYRLDDFNPAVFINPEIVSSEGEIEYEEGCLSVPGTYEKVIRPNIVTVNYQDLNGDHHTLEVEDTLAVCIQHELDHLNGKLFLDRLSLLKRNFIKKKLLKESKR